MDQKKIGSFLKELRNEKNITQETLAEEFHISNRTVSRWETGANMPDISLLIGIAEFYGVSIPEIVNGERKSEKMNEEVKETAKSMSDYSIAADKKTRRQTAWLFASSFVGLAIYLAIEAIGLNTPGSICAKIASGGLGWSIGIQFTTALALFGILDWIKAKIKSRKATSSAHNIAIDN